MFGIFVLALVITIIVCLLPYRQYMHTYNCHTIGVQGMSLIKSAKCGGDTKLGDPNITLEVCW